MEGAGAAPRRRRGGDAVDPVERDRLAAAVNAHESALQAEGELESRTNADLARLLEIAATASRLRQELERGRPGGAADLYNPGYQALSSPEASMNEPVLATAVFDPKVKVYWYFQGLFAHFMLIFAVVGLVTLPLWAIFGLAIVGKRYEALSAQLTDRAVHLRSGVFFRVEMTVPLEKIQDLSLRTGPLLSAFGLASLQIDTAGGNAQHSADMMLPGLSNAEAFRNAVLAQRDRRTDRPGPAAEGADPTRLVLEEIRDSLLRLEALVAARP